jgi:TatA/E family protein of Tat protein translocase
MPIGAPELIIILVIALLILGPGKLPEVGASLGKTIREFRKASTDIQDSVKIDTSPLPPSQQTPQAPSQSTVVPPIAPVGPVTPVETPAALPPEPGTAANPPTTETVASAAASNADPAPRAD